MQRSRIFFTNHTAVIPLVFVCTLTAATSVSLVLICRFCQPDMIIKQWPLCLPHYSTIVVNSNNIFLMWHVYLQQALNTEEPNTTWISARSSLDDVRETVNKKSTSAVWCVHASVAFDGEDKKIEDILQLKPLWSNLCNWLQYISSLDLHRCTYLSNSLTYKVSELATMTWVSFAVKTIKYGLKRRYFTSKEIHASSWAGYMYIGLI